MKNGISDERNETKCERKKEKNNFVCIFPTAEVWFGAANCNTISVGMKSELCRMCTVAIRKRNASSLSFNHSQSTCVFSGRCLRVNMAENSIQRFVAVANHHRTTANEYVWIFSFIDFSLAIEWSDEWKKTHTRRSVDALMSFCSFSPSLSSSVCVCVCFYSSSFQAKHTSDMETNCEHMYDLLLNYALFVSICLRIIHNCGNLMNERRSAQINSHSICRNENLKYPFYLFTIDKCGK